MPRYVLIPDGQVVIELTPDEWAIALDALEKAHADRTGVIAAATGTPPYSPSNRGALYRVVRKLNDAASQLRKEGA